MFYDTYCRYSVEPGDYDPGVGCIVRAITGSLNRDDVEVTRLEQDSGILELIETEELVSNIVELKPADSEKKFNVSLHDDILETKRHVVSLRVTL